MELPADFPDEYKKIGSKRSKFLDLGLPIPKPKVVFVKEYEPANEGTLNKQKTSKTDYIGHKVRIMVHTPRAVIYSGKQQKGGQTTIMKKEGEEVD